jgi:hypothetical protein
MTRLPAANCSSSADVARCGTSWQRESTISGAPFTITVRSPSGSSTSTEASRRSQSNGRTASRRDRRSIVRAAGASDSA